jgi:agmatine/peptidylarginine deiminase
MLLLRCNINLIPVKMKHVPVFLFLLLGIASNVFAQVNPVNDPPVLQHEMTADELLRKHEIGRGFVPTDPPVAPVRNMGEFERMQGALIRYPFGIPMTLIKEMATDVTVTTIVASAAQKNTVLNQYIANGVDTSHCDFLIAPTDSYWTRDYGPWFASDSSDQVGIVDFPYNRPRPNDDEIPKKMADMLGIPWYGMEVISTGGDYMTDGLGISASTDLVWRENPTLTHEQIAQRMEDYLGIANFQVVPDPNISSTIDHIDCWGKFLAPDKMLIRQTLPTDPEYSALEAAAAYWAEQTCSYGYNYRIFRVKTPQDQPYSNSVILNNKVLVPFMNSVWDDSAKAVYEAAMPGYEVIGFTGNPGTPWLSTDALHCRVMGIADIGMLYLRHIPLSGSQPCEFDHVINADIMACSHQPVIGDSTLIHYRVNGGPYQTAMLTLTTANHYTGVIPMQPAGSVIQYFLTTADSSGRSASAPFIGAADPFTFTTVYTNLAAVPDTLWFLTAEDCINGKITQFHNYTNNGLTLSAVQQTGQSWPWWVDSISVAALPHLLALGDSVAVRVKVPLPVFVNPAAGYTIDSMQVTSAAGVFYVIIMISDDLLTTVPENSKPESKLHSFPNPFSTFTNIPVDIKQREKVSLEIFDIRGTSVKTLLSGEMQPGIHTVQWNGTGHSGNELPGGIYLCRLVMADRVESLRILLIR